MDTMNDYIKYYGKSTRKESGQKCPLNDLFMFMKHPLKNDRFSPKRPSYKTCRIRPSSHLKRNYQPSLNQKRLTQDTAIDRR
jgi:hypothetical protein